MPEDIVVTYDATKLRRLIEELPEALADHLDASAFSIEAHAKAPNEFPVDTGALRASGHVVGASRTNYAKHGGTTYQQAVSAAQARWASKGRRPSPIAPQVQPANPSERLIVFPVAYAAWVLDVGRKGRPGFPALTMAVEQERDAFFRGIEELIRRLAR